MGLGKVTINFFLSLVLLNTFAFGALNWPVQKEGTISITNTLNGTFNTNLETGATIQILHSQSIRVCLQRVVQLPDQSRWNVTCTWYKEFSSDPTPTPTPSPEPTPTPVTPTPTPTPEPVTPTPTPTPTPVTPTPTPTPTPAPTTATTSTMRRSIISLSDVMATLAHNNSAQFNANNDQYSWGIQVIDASVNDTVSVWFSGTSCTEGQGYNGTDCTGVTPLENNTPAKVMLNPGGVSLFSFAVGPGAKSISITASSTDGKAVFKSFLRLNGVPSSTVNDKSGDAKVTMTYPQPGKWYAAVDLLSAELDQAVEVSVTFSVDPCAPGSYGPDCNATVTVLSGNALSSIKLKIDTFIYFQVTPSKEFPLQVAFQSSLSSVGISVYGSIGNIPSPDNYLIKGCNFASCHSVTNIQLNFTSNDTWIFAVTTADNDTDVGAWANSICAPSCDSPSGECQTDGPDTGLCLCEDSYVGIDCSVAIGLPSQYIVLIIIAGLVLSSAVIGFIAWAYMRSRRRVQYEKVV